jgi:hypothetical protein
MINFKNIFIRSLILLAFIFSASFSLAARSPHFPPTNGTANLGYFFVQTADKAVIKPGHLTLVNVFPKNIWFAESPSNLAGALDTQEYIKASWSTPNAGFNATHPNASLAGFVMNKKTGLPERVVLILKLKSAKLNNKTQSLSYTVDKLMFAHTFAHVTQSLTIEQPTLFVDIYAPGSYH